MATVVLEELRKSYGGKNEVVKGIDLTIEDGEFLTFVGPSGCGKSTLMNLIAGLEKPSSGNVRIDGDVVNDRSPKERDVAMVFQSYALYPHMNVARNIGFPLEVSGVPKAELRARVEETARRLGIEELLARKPRELSGGQRQRVALGRALVRKPKLCLFDEPLSNLDAALRAQMRAELKKLHEDLKATFVYVTHDQAEAMTLSSRVVVLEGGVIQQAAPPRTVYASPANLFVAGFVGSPRINVVAPDVLRLAPPKEDVLVGVRPEDLTVDEGAEAREDAPRGRIYVVEPMGAETWVTVDIGDARVVARASAEYAGRAGDEVRLRVELAKAHWFDRTTGERSP